MLNTPSGNIKVISLSALVLSRGIKQPHRMDMGGNRAQSCSLTISHEQHCWDAPEEAHFLVLHVSVGRSIPLAAGGRSKA